MSEPQPYDAVLGDGQVPNTPLDAVVLSGIEGIKHRLDTSPLLIRLEALTNAFEYNEKGVKLILQFLKNKIKVFQNSLTVPPQIILEEIEDLHSNQANPKYLAVGYQKLGNLCRLLIEQGESSLEDLTIAISAYQKAMTYDKNLSLFTDILKKRAIAYHNQGYYQAAIQDYSQAITINPNLADMYCGRGIVYCNLWDYQAAIQDYNQALKINPDYIAAYYNRSLVHLFLGNYKEATEDYNKVIT